MKAHDKADVKRKVLQQIQKNNEKAADKSKIFELQNENPKKDKRNYGTYSQSKSRKDRN